MTDINYNAKSKTLEVSVRIFADDFEKTLRKNCNCKVDLYAANKSNMEKLVNNYINKHLQLKIDGQPAALQFSGYGHEEGSVWNYFEVKNINAFKKLELYDTLLYDYNDSQINMVHIKANGKDKTDKLDYPDNAFTFAW